MPGTGGRWRFCAPGLVFAHLGAACFAVKIETTDTLTTVSTLPETITATLSESSTSPPTTVGPTT
ncbi:MAG TPA: hypothetical protein VIK91_06115, partial [Nannocystis sp.]